MPDADSESQMEELAVVLQFLELEPQTMDLDEDDEDMVDLLHEQEQEKKDSGDEASGQDTEMTCSENTLGDLEDAMNLS